MTALFFIRARVLGFDLFPLLKSPRIISYVIKSCYYDWLFVVGMGIVFSGIVLLTTKRSKPNPIIFGSYLVCTGICLFLGLINIMSVTMLKTPLNYQWIYYSGFFESSEMRKIIFASVPWQLGQNSLFIMIAVFGAGYILNYLIFKFDINLKHEFWAIVSIGCLLTVYFAVVGNSLRKKSDSYCRMANPVMAFIESAFISLRDPNEFFIKEASGKVESFQEKDRHVKGSYPCSKKKIRNVIIYVMESVSAEYVSGYNSKYEVTPTISNYLNQAVVFSDIYAHLPVTNSSLVSLLSSLYPMISYKCLSKEYPQLSWPSISSELKNRNYRTAFFHASDNRFQRMDEFLSFRKFDRVSDYRDMRCTQEVFIASTPTWRYLDGIDEECMMDAFSEWVKTIRTGKPFFAMLWTTETHYPYFSKGKEKEYAVGNKELNRYLNALHHSDAMLGKLLNELKKSNLDESTLVVLVGDHGEAFGRHGQMGHGAKIYEENVRVPLIIINPVLFSGERLSVIGGHVDVAPTIMDLLGLPSPEEWQGKSLYDANRANQAFFFNPHSDYLFGYRIPRYKIIFNASLNKTMIFDMEKDPQEIYDLADKMPDLVKTSSFRLGKWVQTHSAILNETIERTEAKKEADINFNR